MTRPDLEPFCGAERLEWHAVTVFDGETPGGDGNIDGDLCAITGGRLMASVPLDIFTPDAWDGDAASVGPWVSGEGGPLGLIIANPRTCDEVGEEVRRWCRREFGRDDVVVALSGLSSSSARCGRGGRLVGPRKRHFRRPTQHIRLMSPTDVADLPCREGAAAESVRGSSRQSAAGRGRGGRTDADLRGCGHDHQAPPRRPRRGTTT